MVRSLCPSLVPYIWPVAPLSSPAPLNSASSWYCLCLALVASCFQSCLIITFLDPTQHNSVVWLGIPAGFFMEKSLSSLISCSSSFFSSSIGDFITLASCFLPSKFQVSQTLLLVYHSSFSQDAFLHLSSLDLSTVDFLVSLTFAGSANHGQNFGEL